MLVIDETTNFEFFLKKLLEKKRQERHQIKCDDEMIGGRYPRYPLVPFAMAWTRLP